ncbi:DEAD/DEAH box helicase [Corallococcus sp. AB011P]|uniref:DEAD/DEAH box helicase n=1 Tax=Corallococcus sp. AB011P TaxID=2316735 RepID=UPI000EA3B7FB|nr:DEAD/DEAH box helicase [Corallococcus sp. AB011P]RKG49884.1 DEAD/DEAH box helicase [Corallococcus sp. AB011P]
MFDKHAQELIDRLPKIAGLDPTACRRTLSRAYLLIVNNRILSTANTERGPEQSQVQDTLRRMANALQSVAVFDPLNGNHASAETTQAAAFAAAEALALLGKLITSDAAPNPVLDPLQDEHAYTLIESALLFMIGGYDINASAIIAEVREPTAATGDSPEELRARNGQRLWQRIKALCEGRIHPIKDGSEAQPNSSSALLPDAINATKSLLYDRLLQALDGYFDWLRGTKGANVEAVLVEIGRIRETCRLPKSGGPIDFNGFSDIFHLASLLFAAVNATRTRALVHGVPSPTDGGDSFLEQFGAYLKMRAMGNTRLRGRPFLWPSTIEYIRDCLPGPNRDAVVSMPTGSGKSFLAELAVAHALSRGWVLYLTPTNALAHQIRRDLSAALTSFSDVSIAAFVGGAEYTALSDEQLRTESFVAVMTPEKCALALRLYPDAFKGCSLCIFDECHLLNDESRGAVADVLLAQLFHTAPGMRILLMSAMVSNSNELADWLTAARRTEPLDAVASKIRWRPSRAARGFVIIDQPALDAALAQGHTTLAAAAGAKTINQPVPLGWIAGLSGPWTMNGPDDYRTAPLPIHATLTQKRTRKGQVSTEIESWKNRIGLAVAEHLASRGAPAINFVLSSRHHAFGSAERVTTQMHGAVGSTAFPEIIEAQLSIADAELGVETCLRPLLRKGVTVHTSAMLQVEQATSEWMFSTGKAKLMIATGTLAQGLNLPAVAVVVSGSQLAGQKIRDTDAAAGLTRANELILNGFGRAGRPGFANQGVVILVSDKPIKAPTSTTQDGAPLLQEYPVLGEPDASISIHSPIEKFLDELMVADQTQGATSLEVSLTSLLATVESAEEHAGKILMRTFGGYRRREHFTEEKAAIAQRRVVEIKQRFLERKGVPSWMPIAAMRAGVDFFRAQHMWEAYKSRGLISAEELAALDVRKSFELLIDVLSHMPVSSIGEYLDEKATATPRTRLGALARTVSDYDTVPWSRPAGWTEAWQELGRVVDAYMQGMPFTEIGAILFNCQPTEFTPKRSDGGRGLPAVFKFLGDIVERVLAQDAGCFLALHECWIEDSYPGTSVPEALQALPLCIRNGANNLDVIAWFRFGYRQRVCAHALAQAFPLDPGLKSDEARARAVRKLRHEWLNNNNNNISALVDFARTVILDGNTVPD